jgi:hypothetical protein
VKEFTYKPKSQELPLVIDQIGGNCPVQAEGTILGKPFYFRARGEHWTLGIGGSDPMIAPEWQRRERWGNKQFEAGWMLESDALAIIRQCATQYMEGRRGG